MNIYNNHITDINKYSNLQSLIKQHEIETANRKNMTKNKHHNMGEYKNDLGKHLYNNQMINKHVLISEAKK